MSKQVESFAQSTVGRGQVLTFIRSVEFIVLVSNLFPASILRKSILGRHDGPI